MVSALQVHATYGSLGAAIGLMTWMRMSAIIVLLGAELNSEIERQAMQKTGHSGQPEIAAMNFVL